MHSLFGLGVTNVGVPGMIPLSMERIVFSRPEIPAAGSECPMLLLTCSIIRSANLDWRCPGITYRADDERVIKSATGSEYRSNSSNLRGISSLN